MNRMPDVGTKRSKRLSALLVLLGALGLATPRAAAQWTPSQDQAFRTAFDAYYGSPRNTYPTVSAYNAAIPLTRFFGETADDTIIRMQADNYFPSNFGGWLEGFCLGYRATGDIRYVRESIKITLAMLAFRDDRRTPPRQLDTGEVAACWSSPLYSYGYGNRAYAVDTGMALHGIYDLLWLAKEYPAAMAEFAPGQYQQILDDAAEMLLFHEPEYRTGPEAGVGRYDFIESRNPYEYYYFRGVHPQPINWSSAMARAFWLSWKITGNTAHRTRALEIGQYFKNRLVRGTDGAYYWRYYLSHSRVPANAPPQSKTDISYGSFSIEDISHAGLSASIAFDLARDGEIFTALDMERFSRTILSGFARDGNGRMTWSINGDPTQDPTLAHTVSTWMRIVPMRKEVFAPLADFYLKYWHSNGPLDGGMLLYMNQRVNTQSNAAHWSLFQ